MRIPVRDKRGSKTAGKLVDLVRTISRSGNPDEPFFYLGGPMSNIPQFNFPRFHEAADALRAEGYSIVSPAELDDPAVAEQAMRSATGSHGDTEDSWEDFLSRDLIVCALPNCVGGIFLEGWWYSDGALGESWVLDFLGKELLAYSDAQGLITTHLPALRSMIDYDIEIELQRAASKWSGPGKPWESDPQWLEEVRRNGGLAVPVREHVERPSRRVVHEFYAEEGHTPGLLAEED